MDIYCTEAHLKKIDIKNLYEMVTDMLCKAALYVIVASIKCQWQTHGWIFSPSRMEWEIFFIRLLNSPKRCHSSWIRLQVGRYTNWLDSETLRWSPAQTPKEPDLEELESSASRREACRRWELKSESATCSDGQL